MIFRNKGSKYLLCFALVVIAVTCGLQYVFFNERAVIITAVGEILITICYVAATCFRYRKISNITYEIDKILDGSSKINFKSFKEGELAILSDRVEKLVAILNQQKETLKKDKIYLSDSIADISHQLKTPLTAINLILIRMRKSDLSREERMSLIRELTRLTERTQWLISVLLKISKIDTGTLVMTKEKISVSDLVKKAYEPVAVAMDLKNQSFVCECGECSVNADFQWTCEAVANIIKNCMEHTPEGGTVKVSASETNIYTEFIIEDNGKGIDPEDLPHIFERFYRGKDSDPNSVGIGLALARMIITGQEGIIKAQNKRDGGARFIIRFYKMVV